MHYFDANATTPLLPEALEAMLPFMTEHFANPASSHSPASRARAAVEQAREQVAEALGAAADEVIFTSGGTEANNLFLKGMTSELGSGELAIGVQEHPSVSRSAEHIARHGQWQIKLVGVDSGGVYHLQKPLGQPQLVSLMSAHNETGVIQPLAQLVPSLKAAGAYVHTDAVQALGKVAINFRRLGVDGMSVSAHKVYGPKGVGALIMKNTLEPWPLLSGGGHEQGHRSGTLNVAAIVGFGVAVQRAVARLEAYQQRLSLLRSQLEAGLKRLGAEVFAERSERLVNTSYLGFAGIEGSALVLELDRAGYAVASGSACSSHSKKDSAGLLAMGLTQAQAKTAIRISLLKDASEAGITQLLTTLAQVLDRLRHLRPSH